MSYHNLQAEVDNLLRILANLKKSPNRKRSRESVVRKLLEIKNTWEAIAQQFESLRADPILLTDEHVQTLLINARQARSQAIDIVKASCTEQEVDLNISGSDTPNTSNMTTSDRFDYTAAQRLPVLSLDSDKDSNESIRDFLNNVRFYHDTLNAEGKLTLVNFVMSCKIQGRALTKLGNARPITFDELQKSVETQCGTLETIDNIHMKLSNAKQGSRNIKDFVRDVEDLITKMTTLEVREQGEHARKVLATANDRKGLAYLKKGVNDRFKMLIDSARHKTFTDAATHFKELDTDPTEPDPSIRYAYAPRDRNDRYSALSRGQNYRPQSNRGNPRPQRAYQQANRGYHNNGYRQPQNIQTRYRNNQNHSNTRYHEQNNRSQRAPRAPPQNNYGNQYSNQQYQHTYNRNRNEENISRYNQGYSANERNGNYPSERQVFILNEEGNETIPNETTASSEGKYDHGKKATYGQRSALNPQTDYTHNY